MLNISAAESWSGSFSSKSEPLICSFWFILLVKQSLVKSNVCGATLPNHEFWIFGSGSGTPPLAWWPTIVRTTINWPINSGPPEVQHRTYLVMSIVNSLEFNIVVRGLISEVQCITQCISGPYKWSETSTFCTSARNTLMCKHQPLPDSEGHNVH